MTVSGEDHLTRHVPVLLPEVMEAIAPLEGSVIVDGTFGAGGYTRGFLDAGAHVIAFDRDPDAIKAGQSLVADFSDKLTLIEAPFSQLHDELAQRDLGRVDAVVLDIGVSSMQLDQAHRGFAFRFDGPLDMRMDQNGQTAADIVNTWSEADLADLFYVYGEERRSRAIAKYIVDVRDEWPITTTRGLANLIEKLMPVRKRGPGPMIHPATRVFQALRIAVNDELGELVAALHGAEQVLKPGGRLAVVTFHSLEDRIVKRFFTEAGETARGSRHLPDVDIASARFETLTRRPVVPGDEELSVNPRARSAKLRAGKRTDVPAHSGFEETRQAAKALGLPLLKRSAAREVPMRVLDGLFLALAIGGAAYVYDVKHQAEEAHDTRRGLEREIRSFSRDVSLLEADLAALEQPARLQGLVASLPESFNLEPIASRHYVRLSDIPFRSDEIETPEPRAIGSLADQGVVSDLDTLIQSLVSDTPMSEPENVPADDIGRLLEGVQ